MQIKRSLYGDDSPKLSGWCPFGLKGWKIHWVWPNWRRIVAGEVYMFVDYEVEDPQKTYGFVAYKPCGDRLSLGSMLTRKGALRRVEEACKGW